MTTVLSPLLLGKSVVWLTKNLAGIFFSNKELNKAKGGTLSNRLSNMGPYKKAPGGRTGAWIQEVFVKTVVPLVFR